MISAEYGWTDAQILDLPFCRFRQIRDVLLERRTEERQREIKDKETELRVLCQFIAAAYGEEGLAWADTVRLTTDRSEAQPDAFDTADYDNLPSFERITEVFSPKATTV